MSKTILFARVFPAYHPKSGQTTNFIEKIYNSFKIDFHDRSWLGILNNLNPNLQMLAEFVFGGIDYKEDGIKYHTIRSGNRWKVGDKFSPRAWSGKPYRSKQIVIAPDIEIKKIWDFEIKYCPMRGTGYYLNNELLSYYQSELVAKNDGLSLKDFDSWFKFPSIFSGQVICWNSEINYDTNSIATDPIFLSA